MPDDPFALRRTGRHRVRVVTASVAAAAVAGTGAVALAVASADSAAAEEATSTSVLPGSDDGGVSSPAQPPRQASGSAGDASSGGS